MFGGSQDLSPEDLEFVRDGRCQLVPSRDAAGRFLVAYNVDREAIYYTSFVVSTTFECLQDSPATSLTRSAG